MFQNPNGSKIFFENLDVYPKNKIMFDSESERDLTLNKIKQYCNIEWTNSPSKTMLSFGLAYFNEQDTKSTNLRVFGRYFKKKNLTGAVVSWPSTKMNGFRLQSNSGKKESAGLNPIDIFGKENDRFDSIDSMMHFLSIKMGDMPELYSALEQIYYGRLPAVVVGGGELFTPIRDYVGEIAHPLALCGNIVSGNIQDAQQKYLNGHSWKTCSIRWPMEKNSELVDSELYYENLRLGISSKGGAGADPSVKNIYNNFEKNPHLKLSCALAWDVISTLHAFSAKEAPIVLAEQFSLHDKEFLSDMRALMAGNCNIRDLRGSKHINKILKMYDADTNNKNYSVELHLLSNLAKDVSAYLNNTDKFCDDMTTSIRSLPMIQIYTKAKRVGNDVHFTGFQGLTPETFDGKIKLNAGKHYTSTSQKGKIAFSWEHKKQRK